MCFRELLERCQLRCGRREGSCRVKKWDRTTRIWSNQKWKSRSSVQLFVTPWTKQSMEFSRPEYWSGLPFPSPGDLPNPGIELRSFSSQADSLLSEPSGKPRNSQTIFQCGWTILHSCWQRKRIPMVLHSCQHWVFLRFAVFCFVFCQFVFWIFAILINMSYCGISMF